MLGRSWVLALLLRIVSAEVKDCSDGGTFCKEGKVCRVTIQLAHFGLFPHIESRECVAGVRRECKELHDQSTEHEALFECFCDPKWTQCNIHSFSDKVEELYSKEFKRVAIVCGKRLDDEGFTEDPCTCTGDQHTCSSILEEMQRQFKSIVATNI